MKDQFLATKISFFKKRVQSLSKIRLILGVIVLVCWGFPLFWESLVPILYPISFLVIIIFSLFVYFQLKLKDFLSYLEKRFYIQQRNLFIKNKLDRDQFKIEKLNLMDFHIPPNPIWEDLDLLKEENLFHFLNITQNKNAGQKIIDLVSVETVSHDEVIKNQIKIRFLTKYQGLRKILLTLLSSVSDQMSFKNLEILLNKELVKDKKLGIVKYIYTYYGLLWIGYLSSICFNSKPFYILGWMGLLVLYPWVSQKIKINESYSWANSFDSQIKRIKVCQKYLSRLADVASNQNLNLLSSFSSKKAVSSLDFVDFNFAVKELNTIISALGIRQNFIVYGIVHAGFPWDIYWTLRLEKLKKIISEKYPLWIEELAEFECFSQIAEYSQNLDHACWPHLSEANGGLHAEQVVHPLMVSKKAISNSVELSKNTTQMILITGSNMAGKSTFLRTMAINQLLALMGSRVTAKEFKTGPYRVLTSLKRTDSLQDSYSTFYSEVKNLKWILEESDRKPCLYFIDEIFRGTNNKERLIGSQKYIDKILKTQSMGIITSHDLELSQLDKTYKNLRNEHFSDQIIDGAMVFDYVKKSGPCPSTNALKVMELAGLFQ